MMQTTLSKPNRLPVGKSARRTFLSCCSLDRVKAVPIAPESKRESVPFSLRQRTGRQAEWILHASLASFTSMLDNPSMRSGQPVAQAMAEHLQEATEPVRQVIHTLMHPEDAAASVTGHIMSRDSVPTHGQTRHPAAAGFSVGVDKHAESPHPVGTTSETPLFVKNALDQLHTAAEPMREVVHTILHPQDTAAEVTGHLMSRTNAPQGHLPMSTFYTSPRKSKSSSST